MPRRESLRSYSPCRAGVAQLVEQGTENPRVGSSILSPGTTWKYRTCVLWAQVLFLFLHPSSPHPLPTSGDWSSPKCILCAYLSCLYSPALHLEGRAHLSYYSTKCPRPPWHTSSGHATTIQSHASGYIYALHSTMSERIRFQARSALGGCRSSLPAPLTLRKTAQNILSEWSTAYPPWVLPRGQLEGRIGRPCGRGFFIYRNQSY